MACCKYNKKSWLFFFIATLFLSFGWVLSVIAIASCNFVGASGSNEGGEFDGMGLFWFQTSGLLENQCFFFDWNSPAGNFPYWTSRKMNAARICSCLAAFGAFWLMCLMWCGIICGCLHGKIARTMIAIFSFVCMALFSGIWAVYGSFSCRGGCSFATGSWCALFAMVCWFISGLILCCTPSHHDGDDDEKKSAAPPPAAAAAAPAAQGETTVTVEKFTNEDGAVVTKTTTTNPDGSKTVEEVTETPLVQAVVDEKV